MRLSANTWISLFVQLLLISMLPYVIYKGNYIYAAGAILAILFAYVPAMVKRNFNLQLPWFLETAITLALFLHISGLAFGWYLKFRFYDVVLHAYGTMIIALLGFMFVYMLYYLGKIKLSIRTMAIFTFLFAMAVGGLWEIAEFSIDHALGTNAQMGSLQDTMGDLIFDGVGGILVAFFGMWYVRKTPEKRINKHLAGMLNRKV